MWTGALLPHTGYGMFWPHGRAGGKVYAHRYSYETFVGPIADGMEIDHTCHTRACGKVGPACLHRRCVNPEHFAQITREANLRLSRGWTLDEQGVWVCEVGHRVETPHADGGCGECRRVYHAEWARGNRRPETAEAKAIRAAQGRNVAMGRLLAEHPELEGEAHRLGLTVIRPLLRHGWTFDGAAWSDKWGNIRQL